jgi:uncharacterized protein (TIGR00299 family) protein
MPALFFDCSSGISGDMTVASLVDLGVDLNALDAELAKLGLANEFHWHASIQSRQMITGTKFDVHVSAGATHHDHHHHEGHSHSHDHDHDHDHPHGRSYREIRQLIESAGLSEFVRDRSIAVFHRIAVAEGRIHGCPPEDVGFHEVGAVDSIVDIVAACICLDLLGQPSIHASYLFDGTGSIHCAHGTFPIPAPATMEILKGIPIRQIDEPMEFITPTGAALLAEFCAGFGSMPLMQIEKIGYGLGTRDTSPRPNVLRALFGGLVTASTGASIAPDEVVEIVTNIDDTTPEISATFPSELLALGALDAFLTPVQMKKNRPGIQLTVLCEKADADAMATWTLTHTSSFGVRMHHCQRLKLDRKVIPVSTAYGDVLVKFGYLGGQCLQASPEFESYAQAARLHGVPIKEVYESALHAASAYR